MEKLSERAARALSNINPGAQKGRLGERIRQLEENASPPPSLLSKVIEIGDWNMDATSFVQIAHGLTLADIRAVTVQIRNDPGSEVYFLSYPSALKQNDCTFNVQATIVWIVREAGGWFDSVDFDLTPYNRGFITIWYKP